MLARKRGRSSVGWFLLAVIISPLLAALLLLVLADIKAASAGGAEVVTSQTHVRCPDCRELVRIDARKCRHCGTALVPQSPSN